MKRKSKGDTIVIEPRTRITSFDTLDYRTLLAVNGAIAGTLFGKDREQITAYYKSRASRENRLKLTRFISQVYAYLNPIISKFANPHDYFFRLWLRLEIDRKTGEIIDVTFFDVDMFKFFGKVGGKFPKKEEEYIMNIVFVGREGTPLSSFFIQGIKKVASEIEMIRLKTYDSYSKTPSNVRSRISDRSPYLIVGDEVLEIKVRTEDSDVIPFIEKDGERIDFPDQISVEGFVLTRVPLKPDIGKAELSFQYVDSELKNIRQTIEDHATDFKKPDILKTLGIESELSDIKTRLTSLDVKKLSNDDKLASGKWIRKIDRELEKYMDLSIEYESIEDALKSIEIDRDKGTISYDEYDKFRMRKFTASRKVTQELIKLKENLWKELVPEVRDFLKKAEGKKES